MDNKAVIVDFENLSTLYKQSYVNRAAETEKISSYLLSNISKFQTIKKISRENSYKVRHRKSDNKTIKIPYRGEELIARKLAEIKFKNNCFGEVIDYQVPLKNKREDIAGKIDLLSYSNNSLYIIEFKREGSHDTLLRSTLEIVTYWHQVNKEKLVSDFDLPNTTVVKKAVLVFNDSKQHKEYLSLDSNSRKLMKELNVDFFLITEWDKNTLVVNNIEKL